MSFDPVWEQIHLNRPWGQYPSEQVVRWVAKNFYSHPERWRLKFLDIGCGAGANSWYLRREGFTCVGIDGSPSAVKRAGPGAIVGDVINLPFPDSEFDCVIDVACICHNNLQDAKRIVLEAHRVLKKGGRIFSIMPTQDCARKPYDGKGKVIFLDEQEAALLFHPEFETEINWTGFSEGSYNVYHWLISGIRIGD